MSAQEQPGLPEPSRVAEARWRAVVDAAVDGIIVIDSRGAIEAFNAAAERMFGYTEGEVRGRNVSMLMPEPHRSGHDGYIGRYLATGERRIIGIGRAVNGVRRDGTVFPLHLSVGEFELDGERHFTGILHDLSRRAELEERLREATALARLGEMAAVIAHEVKNPLAAVRGAVQVIGSRLSGQTDAAIIKEVIARLDALNDLIQDLLVFARPPAPKPVRVNLRALIESVATLLKRDPAFASLGITIAGEARAAHGDPNLLTIAIQNLLINAAQAQQGRGDITVTLSEQPPSLAQIVIRDTGPGIPPEIRAALFRPFKTTKARGTGLGMATAKRLLESQGGQIEVECPPEGGTMVTLRVPLVDEAA